MTLKYLVSLPLLTALALPLAFSPIAGAEESLENSAFNDVPENHRFFDGIHYLSPEHVQGYTDGSFKPDDTLMRVDAVKIVMETTSVFDLSDESLYENTDENGELLYDFPDIDTSQWYWEDYVLPALNLGIVSGHDDGYFRPTDPVTRDQMLKMMAIANWASLTREADDEWYEPYMRLAEEKRLLIPTQEGDYQPGAELSRGELCDLVYRYFEEPVTDFIEFGDATYYGFSWDGSNTSSGTPLEVYGYMAAHKTLPFHSTVRVTNLDNNTFVDVEIVDRGPYVDGRIIDLTPAAFEVLGELWRGVLYNTVIEVLSTEE